MIIFFLLIRSILILIQSYNRFQVLTLNFNTPDQHPYQMINCVQFELVMEQWPSG